MKYQNIREEELKNNIAQDYFWLYDCKKIIGNVDFCVSQSPPTPEGGVSPTPTLPTGEGVKTPPSGVGGLSLLWAEAKKGSADLYKSIVQLILTIGKARTFDKYLPPPFLGAFDAEKIAFVPYSEIYEVFYQNDFNWNVAPSNHDTKEFKLILDKVKSIIDEEALLFFYEKDDKELKLFIKENFVVGKLDVTKIRVDKNNFISIYTKWLATVKPTIGINWEIAKKNGILDADFYLADLLSKDNESLKEALYVLLKKTHYELDRKIDEMGMFNPRKASFLDQQKAHTLFWNKYERPPKEEYWDYIVERRDLLVPQDVRERKGSFFTPQIWVELSQKYLADVLGEDWQDEYYIWDCAAGTGNLLAGLTNKSRIFASTLDKQDVDVMKDRIQNGANLIESHVFQFDFLNDSFDKLPKALQEIVNSPEKRKKLVVYINPPYAEASSYGKASVPQVANETKIFNSYKNIVGAEALNELFAQFFIRIYKEIPTALLAAFSPPKYITSGKFAKFRSHFLATHQKGFICKSNTFDNVNGKFPICFSIWDLDNKKEITKIETNVFLNDKEVKKYWQEDTKTFYVNNKSIADWRKEFYVTAQHSIGSIIIVGPSMQSNDNTFITNYPAESYQNKGMVADISKENLIEMSIYLAVRQCIELTWINNSDHFLYPNKEWEKDTLFQADCLTFTIFHRQNKISATAGTNYWIPFTEQEVQAKTLFSSSFMTDFIKGKLKANGNGNLLETEKVRTTPLVFSSAAQAVFDAGRELWRYYHSQSFSVSYGGVTMQTGTYNVNASLYDIKEFFQQRNASGKMNNKSDDEKYNELMSNLREALKVLAQKIEPKVYEHGFLNA